MKKRNYCNVALANGFPVIPRGQCIWKAEVVLVALKNGETTCPRCGVKLGRDQTKVPVGQMEDALIPILYCPRCRTSYVCDREKVAGILRDNSFAVDFTLDGEQLWNATQRKAEEKRRQQILLDNKRFRGMLASIKSAVCCCISVIIAGKNRTTLL